MRGPLGKHLCLIIPFTTEIQGVGDGYVHMLLQGEIVFTVKRIHMRYTPPKNKNIR